MGYKKTDPSKDVESWARNVRNKTHHKRTDSLKKEEDREEDEEKNKFHVNNN